MSVASISRKHHDQDGQPNGNQKHRPIHDVEAKEPRCCGFILIVKQVCLLTLGSSNGSRSVMSNKRRQHASCTDLLVNLTDYGYAAKRQIADTTDVVSGLAQSREFGGDLCASPNHGKGETKGKSPCHGCAKCTGEQRHYDLIDTFVRQAFTLPCRFERPARQRLRPN
jgi:hypothetical protein